jgi:hypothetical protein
MARSAFGRQGIWEAPALQCAEIVRSREKIETEIEPVSSDDAGRATADLNDVCVRHNAPL